MTLCGVRGVQQFLKHGTSPFFRYASFRLASTGAAMDFADTRVAYSSHTDKELRRSLLVLKLSSLDTFVDRSLQLMSLGETLLPARLYEKLMKQTFYGQFIAGETDAELLETAERFFAAGIRSIPQAAIEDELEEEELLAADIGDIPEKNLDRNVVLLEECLGIGEKVTECGGRNDHHNTKVAFKVSAVVHPKLLTHLSPAVAPSGQLPVATVAELSAMMERHAVNHGYIDAYTRALERLHRLMQKVEASRLTALFDAEYSYMQPAICALVLIMQSEYNKRQPVVYNTQQAYLKKAIDDNARNLDIAQRSGFQYAAKVVRGAYMDSERAFAQRLQRPDPIHETYQDTNASYDHVVNVLLERAALGEVGLMVACHNENSVNIAAGRMQELGVDRRAGSISFAQLMGLCDHITFRLGHEGYLAYKVVHYGSIRSTLPFLCRRAQENRAVAKGFRREQELISKELAARQTAKKSSSPK